MSDGYEPTQYDMPPVTPPGGQPAVGDPVPGGPVPPGVPVPPGGPLPPGGPGDGLPPEPDRRPWIIGGLVALIVLVAIILLLVGGDDDDGEDVATDATTTTSSSTTSTSSTTTSTTTSTTVAPTTTTEAPTTTAAPTTTTAAPSPPTSNPDDCEAAGSEPDDPDAAALAVYDAWTRDDTACAAELMSADARDQLFDRSFSGTDEEFAGCFANEEGDEASDEQHFDCAFLNPAGSTTYHMVFSPTEGWQVFEVTQSAD